MTRVAWREAPRSLGLTLENTTQPLCATQLLPLCTLVWPRTVPVSQVCLDCSTMLHVSVRKAGGSWQQSTQATPLWYSLEARQSCTSEMATERQPRRRLPVSIVPCDAAPHRKLFPGASARVCCREAHDPLRKLFVRKRPRPPAPSLQATRKSY